MPKKASKNHKNGIYSIRVFSKVRVTFWLITPAAINFGENSVKIQPKIFNQLVMRNCDLGAFF